MLTAEQLLQPDDLPVEEVRVPEWGGSVHVRTLRADERDDLEQKWLAIRDAQGGSLTGFRAFLVAFALANPDGTPLFADPSEVYCTIGQKRASAVDRVFEVASRMNGVSKKDEEELEKNC
jgi:hypothetical protein